MALLISTTSIFAWSQKTISHADFSSNGNCYAHYVTSKHKQVNVRNCILIRSKPGVYPSYNLYINAKTDPQMSAAVDAAVKENRALEIHYDSDSRVDNYYNPVVGIIVK